MAYPRIIIFVLLAFAVLLGLAQSKPLQDIISPDGKFVAKVLEIGKSASGVKESIVEITNRKGLILAHKDYTSDDGEHGLTVDTAAWTPDGGFFIFTTFSSGGHMAWQFPTFFFSVADQKVYPLSDYLPPVADSRFSVKKPDLVTMTIWTPMSGGKTLDESIMLPITFKMGDLLKSKDYFFNPNKGNHTNPAQAPVR